MTLREKIAEKIQQQSGNTDAAAIAVCVLLEDEIGLAENGWFDGDDVVLKAIGWGEG